jgi:hypothetical protein
MSMIVAIEPDRRRAAQLTGMARTHLRDELLVAPTAAQAVDALNGRVPDVLLTAPLLPSQEESAIHEYLRQLGSAAAHVQTLTSPLLAAAADERDRPVFSAFRRGRTQHVEAEGCDPAVFAEQITEYLREARERKIVAPVHAPLPAVDAVEATHEAQPINLPEPDVDVASFTVEDPAPAFTGRRFKELLARFEVTDDDEAIVSAAVIDEPFAAAHQSSVLVPETVIPITVISETIQAPIANAGPERRQKLLPQDNWAFFDPNQCGFPALIAKLDEIASRDGDG